jgi:glycosyltransferase involved in cell wall biosynthesis
MTKVAIVQSHPYDGFFGGDGAYLQSLAQGLSMAGHEVHGLITNIVRGRGNPIYRSVYPIERYPSWHVKGAWRIGRRTFVALNPNYPKAVLRSALKQMNVQPAPSLPAPLNEAHPDEEKWVLREIERQRINTAILCFGAVHFAPFIARHHVRVFALPGFLGTRSLINKKGDGGWAVINDEGDGTQLDAQLSKSLQSADCTGFNNLEDMAYAAHHFGIKPVMLVGMGFGCQANNAESGDPIVLFVGNNTPANRQAISWMISDIWPIVKSRCPEASLRIVGRIAIAKEATAADDSVKQIGPVRDLSSEYFRAQLVVAPLRSGSAGLKTKVAEAMSFGRPLVTTSVGVDFGNKQQLDDGAIVADGAADFAHAVVSLLSNRELRRRKSEGARSVFEKNFSYTAAYAGLLEWLNAEPSGSPEAAA